MNKFPNLRLPDKLIYERIADKYVRLHASYGVVWEGGSIRVPAGFECDLSSIPRALHWLIPKTGMQDGPSVIHDYLYELEEHRRRVNFPQMRTREWCDDLLLACMVAAGVNWARRNLMYLGVRAGGGIAWAT
jgi:hypothetical protein